MPFAAPSSRHAQKPRGIIILDTCSLIHLMTPIPREYLTADGLCRSNTPRLTDALFYLAAQGFEIHIPEIVAIECGNYLRSGHSYTYLVRDPDALDGNDELYSCMVPEHMKAPTSESDFSYLAEPFFKQLREARENGLPVFIDPPATNDTSNEARFARLANIVMEDEYLHDDEKCTELRGYWKQYPFGRDAGEAAARRMIKDCTDPETPVFFLSDDIPAQEKLSRQQHLAPVCALGSAGFYQALFNAKILEKLGIKQTPLETLGDALISPAQSNMANFNRIASRADTALPHSAPSATSFSALLQTLSSQHPTPTISLPAIAEPKHSLPKQGKNI